jgi:hypothetical protein
LITMAAERRRADRFAAAADGTSHIHDSETQRFLAIVEQLRAVEPPAPDPGFVGDLRSRLLTAAIGELVAIPVERRPAPGRTRSVGARRRLISAAAVTCIISGSGVGVAAASESALPGDVLYPVKRGIESVELSLAASPADRGQRYVDDASTRLSEARALASTQAGDPAMPGRVVSTLADFSAEANHAATELITAYRQDDSAASIADLRTFAGASTDQLHALAHQLHGIDKTATTKIVQSSLLVAARTVTNIDGAARTACTACSSLPPLTLQDNFAALQSQVHQLQDHLVPTPTKPGAGGRPHGGPGHHGSGRPAGGHTGGHGHGAPTHLPGVSATPQPTLVPTPTLTPSPTSSSLTSSQSAPPVTSPISPSVDPTTPSVSLPSTSASLPSPTVPSTSISLPTPSVSLPTPKVSPPTTSLPLSTTPSVSLPTAGLGKGKDSSP